MGVNEMREGERERKKQKENDILAVCIIVAFVCVLSAHLRHCAVPDGFPVGGEVGLKVGYAVGSSVGSLEGVGVGDTVGSGVRA